MAARPNNAGRRRISVVLSSLVIATASACTPVEYEDHWMDSPSTEDPSLSDSSYLLSTRIPAPTQKDLETPVIVAVHGFGASTYEWMELRDYAEERGVYVSLVLLGGHGRSLDVWVETDDADWRAPILEELRALDALGYRNVSLATSSTGGTLVMQAALHGELEELSSIKNLMLVAPFIVSLDQRLYVAPVLGPILNNVPGTSTDLEKELFYFNRPAAVFNPLMNLLNEVAGALEGDGIELPGDSRLTVWLGRDPIVAPQSATLLRDGVRSEEPVVVIDVDTDRHVHTRAIGRARTAEESVEDDDDGNPVVWTEDDDARQLEAFDELIALAKDA
jgi:carboxylesterase